jgi:hypothetical protein
MGPGGWFSVYIGRCHGVDFDEYRTVGGLAEAAGGFLSNLHTGGCEEVLVEEAVQVLPAVIYLHEYDYRFLL